jgi:hypothetical protein
LAERKYHDAGGDRISGQYIVVLNDDEKKEIVDYDATDIAKINRAELRTIWKDGIKGFAAHMSEMQARILMLDPRVKYVEENAQWHLSGSQQTNINPATCNPTVTTCTGTDVVTDNRLWHLDRADQNYADPTNSYNYCTEGTGVTVYVVDTGVKKDHQEFGNRVTPGYNATGDANTNDYMPADDPCLGFTVAPDLHYPAIEKQKYDDEMGVNSHGTAVASAVGGERVGIAKKVTIVPIKVWRCDYNSSRVRISNHFYPENKTMLRSQNGSTIDAVYRCITAHGGSTLEDPGGWPTAVGATKVDGGVTWKVLDPIVYRNIQTTEMLIDGLDWILRDANPGPKSNAVVTLSTYKRFDDITGANTTVEDVVRRLLANNLTVIASANNQNGDACDTSPSRISKDNPILSLQGDVITAGGSMMINRPWNVNLTQLPALPDGAAEADGGGGSLAQPGPEPEYSNTKAVREGRWICGQGDSVPCSNITSTRTPDPHGDLGSYYTFEGGSNAGRCVTLFAPAKNLVLATTSGNGADYRDSRLRKGLGSGTSWSAPIVAGFAARILEMHPGFTPVEVRTALLDSTVATLDPETLNSYDYTGVQLTGTPNKLLRTGDINITQQPSNKVATPSDSVTLTAHAGGTSTPSYQWYKVDPNSNFDLAQHNGAHFGTVGTSGGSSIKIPGATSDTYQTLPTSTNTGYWMRATNLCGSADTDIAVVTIVPCSAPAVTSQPQSVSVPAGTGVTLSVTATGTSLTYQWYVGSSGVTTNPIGGATSASASVTPSSTTTYWVRVSNSCGTFDSTAATVTVQPIVAANFYLIAPCRILDTRGGTPVPANGVLNLGVFGKCGVPNGATALAINVTVVSPATGGLVTLYPGPVNTVKPIVSTINYTTGRTLANNARITIGLDGSINMFNAAGTPLDFLIDVSGYFQ